MLAHLLGQLKELTPTETTVQWPPQPPRIQVHKLDVAELVHTGLTLATCWAAGEKGFTKIKVKNSIVDLDGDEMTRYY